MPAARDEVGFMFVGQPELSEQALRALELKGDLPLRVCETQLGLGIQVDDWSKPEYWWARRGLLTAYRLAVAANAGFPSVAQLIVPGSFAAGVPAARPPRALVTVERLILTNNTAAVIQPNIYLATTTTPTFTLGAAMRDDRMRANLAAPLGCGMLIAGVINTATAPTGPAAGGLLINVPANSTVIVEVNFVVTGLGAFTIVYPNNTAMECAVITRERPLLSSEG